MKIIYIHGFGSSYDPTHMKIKELEALGEVVGISVDYCKGYTYVKEALTNFIIEQHVDLIVGTSMGGYMASHLGNELGLPFVALNPATTPAESLKKWQGNFVNFKGEEFFLGEGAIISYPPISTNGCGLILLEAGDDVINSWDTQSLLEEHFNVVMFPAGTHRFSNMNKAIPYIKRHSKDAGIVYS